MAVSGEDILDSLRNLKCPVDITELVAYLSSKGKGSATSLMEVTKVLLKAGVQFGCILEEENKFRCQEELKEKMNTEISSNEMNSSNSHVDKPTNKKRKSVNRMQQYSSSDDEVDNNASPDETADCYGPSSRRRNRSRSRRRKRSGKRLSSRRKRFR